MFRLTSKMFFRNIREVDPTVKPLRSPVHLTFSVPPLSRRIVSPSFPGQTETMSRNQVADFVYFLIGVRLHWT